MIVINFSDINLFLLSCCRVYIFEKGAHNLHLRYPEEFNKLVTDFLLEQSKM